MQSNKIAAIQLLRAAAALGVMILHLTHNFEPGAAGVDIFFVISGFVIVVSSVGLFGRSDAPLIFMWRRLIRIVPIYWISTLAVLWIWPQAATSAWRVISCLLFIPSEGPGGVYQPIVPVGWTLIYEMLFYCIFAVCIVLPMRSAIAVASGLVACIAATTLFIRPSPFFGALTNPMMLEFTFGCGLAIVYLSGFRLPRAVGALSIVAGLAGIVWAAPAHTPQLLYWGIPSLLVVGGATLTPWSFGKATALVDVAGDASYALYLTHATVIATVNLDHFSVTITCIVIALAIHLAIERPMTKWLRWITFRRQVSPSPVPQSAL